MHNYQDGDERIIDAKEMELKNLVENDVYEWVEDCRQKIVTCKWIITEKEKNDGTSSAKDRLFARGFEESLTERTDSLICSKQSLRMLSTVASAVNWDIESIDIKAAFLQRDELERDLFIHPIKELSELGKIWKIKRCIYGLCDAPRNGYNRVKHELINKLGGQISKFDKVYFLWHHEDGTVSGIIALLVDDFIYCDAIERLLNVVEPLKKVFKIC